MASDNLRKKDMAHIRIVNIVNEELNLSINFLEILWQCEVII